MLLLLLLVMATMATMATMAMMVSGCLAGLDKRRPKLTEMDAQMTKERDGGGDIMILRV